MCTCCVPTCSYSFKKGSGIKMHKFPSKPELHNQWMAFLKALSSEFQQRPNSRVCSYHFVPDDYTTTKQGNIVLKSNAVPTKLSFLQDEDDKQLVQVFIAALPGSDCSNEDMNGFTYIKTEESDMPLVENKRSVETQTDTVSSSGKRFGYVGDFSFEDLECLTTRKLYWEKTQDMKRAKLKAHKKDSKKIQIMAKYISELQEENRKLKETKRILVYLNKPQTMK